MTLIAFKKAMSPKRKRITKADPVMKAMVAAYAQYFTMIGKAADVRKQAGMTSEEIIEQEKTMSTTLNARKLVDAITPADVANYQKVHGGTKQEASRELRKGITSLAKGGSTGSTEFAAEVTKNRTDGMSRTDALRKARKENPAAFKAWNGR